MPTETIPLNQLQAHPANSNVMPERLLEKLVAHIKDTDHYPPLIVRQITGNTDAPAHATDMPAYQILDGHHRVEAAKRLGHDTAECVIWQADDQQALLLLATLNRLQGQDDPRKRAALVSTLTRQHDSNALAKLLPERIEQVKKLLEINTQRPTIRAPQPIEQMPVAVHFFLLPEQKQRVHQRLHQLGGTREEALMKLIDQSA